MCAKKPVFRFHAKWLLCVSRDITCLKVSVNAFGFKKKLQHSSVESKNDANESILIV